MQASGVRVVTPEAVVLDVRTAGLGSRAIARVLDGLLQAIVLFVVFFVTAVASASGRGGVAGLVVVLVVLTVVVVGYPILWEWLWRGRTPGKAALGLRVVTRHGAPIRFRHAVVRGILGLLEVTLLPVVGVLCMLVSRNEQRFGDLAAGTIVIRERATGRPSAPAVFYPPAGWEPFVASLDVSGMAAVEYETVRAFLLRSRDMAPGPRGDLALRLAVPLAARWHQAVPAGAGPELWLACVAAAYQQRHGGAWAPQPGWGGGPPPGWGGGPPPGWGGGPPPGPVAPPAPVPPGPVAPDVASGIGGGAFTPPA